MKISNNIELIPSDYGLLNNIHNHNLEIATLNLENFNLRLHEHMCRLYYNINKKEFEPVNTNDLHSAFIAEWINYFIYWDDLTEDSKENLLPIYISLITNHYFDKAMGIINVKLTNNSVTDSDRIYFKKECDLFKLRFKDYSPQGILSTEQELKIKSEFNRLCDELDYFNRII